MLTTDIIITGVLFLLASLCLIASLFANEGPWVVIMFFLGLLFATVHFGLISAEKKGNIEDVTYYFPADTYDFEMVVNDRTTKTIVDGVEVETVSKDTTYVLKGIEPIFQMKGDKEQMHLKTVKRDSFE